MKNPLWSIGGRSVLLLSFFSLIAGMCAAQKLAITIDDLPSEWDAAAGGDAGGDCDQDVLAILKKRHVPPVYGFINAKKLEGSADGAEALKLVGGGGASGKSYLFAHGSGAEHSGGVRAGDRGERAGAGVAARRGMTGTGCAIRICMRETRWRSGARCEPI